MQCEGLPRMKNESYLEILNSHDCQPKQATHKLKSLPLCLLVLTRIMSDSCSRCQGLGLGFRFVVCCLNLGWCGSKVRVSMFWFQELGLEEWIRETGSNQWQQLLSMQEHTTTELCKQIMMMMPGILSKRINLDLSLVRYWICLVPMLAEQNIF